jgi:hypothetical protein
MEFFGLKKNTKSQRTVKVSSASLDYFWKLRYENATVGACCSFLTSRILGQGLYYESKSGKKASARFNSHVNKFFLPFARKALDSLLVQGFVIFDVHPPADSDYPIPFVLSPDSYEINVHQTERGFVSLRVNDKSGKRKKTCSFQILDMPTEGGVCTSKVALVSQSISYMEEVEKQDLQAFAIRAHPPVLTKTKTDNVFDSRDVISGHIPGLRAQDEHDQIEMRNKITIAQTRTQQDLIRTLNNNRIDSSSGFWTSQMNPNNRLGASLKNDSDQYAPNFIPLPNDADIAKFELPEEKSNMGAVWQHVRDQICMGMGVPESFLRAASIGARSGMAMKSLEDFIRLTTGPLTNSLNSLMLDIYTSVFEGVEEEAICHFPSMVNTHQLIDLYSEGLLTKMAVARHLAPIYGLAVRDMMPEGGEHEDDTTAFDIKVKPGKHAGRSKRAKSEETDDSNSDSDEKEKGKGKRKGGRGGRKEPKRSGTDTRV